MENNYLLVHGSFGNPFSNWIPYLRSEIENKNLTVYTPDFPTGVRFQNYDAWSKLLRVYADSNIINENTVIFAHSIAPIFICKFLVQNKIRVKRLVFVCGFNNYFGINEEYDTVNRSMYFENLAEVKKYANEIICFYSDNDPYVPQNKAEEFAECLEAEKVLINSAGHFNEKFGYKEFREILKYL